MADINEINEATEKLNESIRDLGVSLENIASSFSSISSQVGSTSANTSQWNDILEVAAKEIKGLPGSIQSGKDLWKAMTSDAELFKKVQTEIKNITKNELSQALEDTSARLEAANASQAEWNKALTEHAIIEREVNALLDKNLDFAKKIVNAQKEVNKNSDMFSIKIGNVASSMKEMGNILKDPNLLLAGMLSSVGSMPKKLLESNKILKKMKTVGKFLFSPTGLLVAGVALASAAVIGLTLLFKNYWDFIDKKVLPAQADFNKQIGGSSDATGKLESQMTSMGTRFEKLGMTFQEGAGAVRSVAEGLKTVELDPKTLKTGTELVTILGLSADEVGRMGLQFQKATGSIEGVNVMMNVGAKEATKYGLPVNAVLKDLATSPGILARFGSANVKEFAKAGVRANSYGLSIKEVNSALGSSLDSFEGSANAAAKLNTIFGTNINSMELMMETDTTKRMEILRKELVTQGKTWDKLDVFQKNVIKSATGLNDAQAALAFSSEDERKKLLDKAKQREKQIKIDEKWNKGINSIKKTLIAWGVVLDEVTRRATEFVFALLGFDEPGKNVHELALSLKKGFADLGKTFSDWTAMLKGDKEASTFIVVLQKMVATAKGLWTVFKVLGAVILDVLVAPFKILDSAVNGVFKTLNSLYNLFLDFTKGNFKEGIKSFFSATIDNFKGFFSVFGKLGEFTGSALGFGKKTSMEDAIVPKVGKMNVNPKKTSIQELIPKLNASATTVNNDALKTELNTLKGMMAQQATTAAAAAVAPQVKVEVVDVNIDGRKIGEMQVRISQF